MEATEEHEQVVTDPKQHAPKDDGSGSGHAADSRWHHGGTDAFLSASREGELGKRQVVQHASSLASG